MRLPTRLTCPAVDNLAIAIQGSGLTRRRGGRYTARHADVWLAFSTSVHSRFSRLHGGPEADPAWCDRMMPAPGKNHWSLHVAPLREPLGRTAVAARPWRPAELAASTRIFVGQRLVDDLWEAARAWDASGDRTCASELRALLTRAGVKPSHRLPMPVQG